MTHLAENGTIRRIMWNTAITIQKSLFFKCKQFMTSGSQTDLLHKTGLSFMDTSSLKSFISGFDCCLDLVDFCRVDLRTGKKTPRHTELHRHPKYIDVLLEPQICAASLTTLHLGKQYPLFQIWKLFGSSLVISSYTKDATACVSIYFFHFPILL